MLIAFHVFALPRKDRQTTPITAEFPVNILVEGQQELGELMGEYCVHDHCLDNAWDDGSDSEFEDEVA